MTTPIDTTDAVAQAVHLLDKGDRWELASEADQGMYRDIARVMIGAHNKAMAEAVPEQFVHIANRGTVAAEHFVRGFNEARRLFLGEAAQ